MVEDRNLRILFLHQFFIQPDFHARPKLAFLSLMTSP
jgi:hypothetical protein